ncbi:alpha/beta fold hydrolase [Aquibacillus rhizosphaerae]|uniref:Alpha/beta hydrolase n=1 Tax=Aquibacillus rhizosphaerae TaxID=3051431 RepID=A0ABT7L1H2_9BACI|nr:alpha/beta hydrolase [Aquibacillus sp. LR5S19]MDL4839696.1 alpha/beta hydrolase [Aquibacillus sp. LR5S19]
MKSITFDNGIVYYEQLGNGIPIIFIHPPGMGRRVFDYQKKLAEHYRIILPDLSGHGQSRSFMNGPIIRQYVKELNLILEEESIDQAIILGYSAGGMIAQEFSLSYPLKTKAIVLSGGYPRVATPGLTMLYKMGMNLLKSSPTTLINLLAFSHARDPEYRKILAEHMKYSDVNHWYKYYEETYHYNCVKKLNLIIEPLLVVYGQNSFWVNKHNSFYDRCGNSEIAMIKNGFHQVPTKKWLALNHVVENFIERNCR